MALNRKFKCGLVGIAGILAVGFLTFGNFGPARDAATKPPAQHLFTMNLGTEPPTLDPAEANDLVSITILANTLRGLTQYGANHQIVPAAASRWEVNAEGTRYVFHLRPQAKWSDGKPLTANDFVYAWRRVLDPAVASSYAFLLFDIHGARDFYEGRLKDPSGIGIKALDPQTLEIRLDRPTAFFTQILAFSITLPVREDSVKQYGTTFTEAGHFITNGPYTLSEWSHENQIILKPNRYYWGGVPQNEGIKMVMIPEPNTSLIMYENNELDFVETASSLPTKEVRRLKTRPDFHQQTLDGISYFGFNTQKKPFDDARVRKAFAMAFDRQFIPKIFQGGEKPFSSFITPGLFAYNPQIGLPFNVEKARKLLAEAGYPEGKGFPTVELLYANTTPENRQLSEIAQFQWKKNLGVPVEIRNVEWKVFLKQLDEDPPPIFRLQWYVDYPDPDSYLGVFISESGNNHTRWTDKRYDAWVKQAAIEQNPAKRKALYDQAQRLLLEDTTSVVPVNIIPKSYLVKPNVKGFKLNQLNLAILDNVHY